MKFFMIIFVLFNISVSETHLSGDIKEKTFDSTGNPYIVLNTIQIIGKKPTIFKEGCVLFFKPFTGIIVRGPLVVSGEVTTPVVFTSISDNLYNPKSDTFPSLFDWNGIDIKRSPYKVHLSNFRLCYSVYGIKSQKVDIRVDKGVFRNNGQFHFTINGQIQPVQDDYPYTYKSKEPEIQDSVKEKDNSLRNSVFVISATSFVASGGLLIATKNKYQRYKAADKQADIDALKNDRNNLLQWTKTSGILGSVFFVAGIGITIFDKGKKIKDKIVLNSTSEEMSFSLVIDF